MAERRVDTDSKGEADGQRRRHRPAPRPASLRIKFLVAVISSLLGIAGIEVGLRLVGRGPLEVESRVIPTSELHPDPRLAEAQVRRWIPAPSTVERFDPFPEHPDGFLELRHNRAGLRRDDEVSLEPAEGEGRVLILGDSHAEGMVAQHETFASLLETQEPAPFFGGERTHWKVLNGAFRRSSPFEQWIAYDRAYRAFSPDHVIVAFYVGNDLSDLLRTSDRIHLVRDATRGWVEREPEVATNATEDRPGFGERIKRPLRQYSAIYRALTEIDWLRRSVVSVTGSSYRNRLEEAARLESGWVWQAANQVVYFRERPEEVAIALDQLQWIWTRMRDELRAGGCRLTILVIPAAIQIHPEAWPERRAEIEQVLELDRGAWEVLDEQTTAVVDLAQSLGIDCLDMTPVLRAAAAEDTEALFYYGRDQHLNAAGHAQVARQLRSFWEQASSPPDENLSTSDSSGQ